MGTMFKDEKPAVAAIANKEHEPFIKSERETKMNDLAEAVKANEPGAAKALLEHIEGDEYFAKQAEHGVKIILFNGPPRSGKDTAAGMAMSILGKRAEAYRFAAPLKDAFHALHGYGDVPTEYFNKVKDQPFDDFKGVTPDGKLIESPRDGYIFLSEDVAKPAFGDDFFARVAVTKINRMRKPIVVISDCGFEVEVRKLVEAFGSKSVALVHLYREGCAFKTDNVKDSRSYVTTIECEQFMINNDSTVDVLYDNVGAIIEKFAPLK